MKSVFVKTVFSSDGRLQIDYYYVPEVQPDGTVKMVMQSFPHLTQQSSKR